MLVLKTIHKDGSTLIKPVLGTEWDSTNPTLFNNIDTDGNEYTSNPGIARVILYHSGIVIFTRDLTTGQPIEYFNV